MLEYADSIAADARIAAAARGAGRCRRCAASWTSMSPSLVRWADRRGHGVGVRDGSMNTPGFRERHGGPRWTGQSGGLLSRQARVHGRLARPRVRERSSGLSAWRRDALTHGVAAAQVGHPLGLETRDSCWWPGERRKELLREYDAREAGVSVAWMTRRQVTAVTPLDVPAAMRSRDAFVFNPYLACVGMAKAAAQRGATIFERSAVKKVRPGRRHVEILTGDGVVRARTVVVATGRPTAEFRPLQRHFKSRETYLSLSAPMPAAIARRWRPNGHGARRPRNGADAWCGRGGPALVTAPIGRAACATARGRLRQRTTADDEAMMSIPRSRGSRSTWVGTTYGAPADGLIVTVRQKIYRHLFASATGDRRPGRSHARMLGAHSRTIGKNRRRFGWTR